MCRCACPAPHSAPAALTPGHTSHSGSNEGEMVNVFGEVQEQEDRDGGQEGRRAGQLKLLKVCFASKHPQTEIQQRKFTLETFLHQKCRRH